jgi:AraC-like DNA-binding protein
VDPIADAIGLLRPRVVVEEPFLAAGPWALRRDPFPHVTIGGVVRGSCWLAIHGREPLLLEEGDFYLLGNPPEYVLADAGSGDVSAPPTAEQLWQRAAAAPPGAEVVAKAEADTYLCTGLFVFDRTFAGVLMDVLPALVHVRAGDPRGALLANISELVVAETGTGTAVGSALVLDHLAQVMFVHMIRAHVEQADRPAGWLGALCGDGVGAALRAMHADVGHRWTLPELAGVAHMSRSAFAAAFRRQVGAPPLDYLIAWRMSLARDALRRRTRTISELASATGYETESAFSTAFRRVVGLSPRQYRDASLDSLAASGH